MKKLLILLLLLPLFVHAQDNGGISADMLAEIRRQAATTPADAALQNALAGTAINDVARTASHPAMYDKHFSHTVPSRGITNQQSSGRCWLFTGLNVLRAQMMRRHDVGEFYFSQNFCFFYDQLEKANLFLQAVIDHAGEPMDGQTNQWLFQHPLSDGGTFCGVQDVVLKYGVVPAEIFPERFSANNTSRMSTILSLKLREYGLALRRMVEKKAKAKDLQAAKTEQLATVYHILTLCLGTPPESFEWTRRTSDGTPVETRTYTPTSFYREYLGNELKRDYVMLMNDPSRPFYETYTIDLDRHSYDGTQWTFLNVPMQDIKDAAVASIRDTVMMYFSCDVGQCYDSKSGILALENFDYESLFSTTFPMTKAERILTGASASSHAMTLMGVDIQDGATRKWKVENSWGATRGEAGHLIMTDGWFDEYMFRLVVERKYLPQRLLDLVDTKTPHVLPAWDPLFAGE